jgi:hypothetical protein
VRDIGLLSPGRTRGKLLGSDADDNRPEDGSPSRNPGATSREQRVETARSGTCTRPPSHPQAGADETWLLRYNTPSAVAVVEDAGRVDLQLERIVEVLED